MQKKIYKKCRCGMTIEVNPKKGAKCPYCGRSLSSVFLSDYPDGDPSEANGVASRICYECKERIDYRGGKSIIVCPNCKQKYNQDIFMHNLRKYVEPERTPDPDFPTIESAYRETARLLNVNSHHLEVRLTMGECMHEFYSCNVGVVPMKVVSEVRIFVFGGKPCAVAVFDLDLFKEVFTNCYSRNSRILTKYAEPCFYRLTAPVLNQVRKYFMIRLYSMGHDYSSFYDRETDLCDKQTLEGYMRTALSDFRITDKLSLNFIHTWKYSSNGVYYLFESKETGKTIADMRDAMRYLHILGNYID